MQRLPFLTRLWIWLSQGVNAFRYAGDPGESLSARCWRQRSIPEWSNRHQRIDRWLGLGHCKRVYEQQKEREDARRVSGG
jgi:hypothetical protein